MGHLLFVCPKLLFVLFLFLNKKPIKMEGIFNVTFHAFNRLNSRLNAMFVTQSPRESQVESTNNAVFAVQVAALLGAMALVGFYVAKGADSNLWDDLAQAGWI